MLVVHLIYDCRDAMGANMVNTACEALAPVVEEITGGRVNLRILSNLADRRLARARCVVPAHGAGRRPSMPGELVAQRIVEAYALAAVDPYRAATHNKGIMNGIDAVVIATGNDWRAIEAGAHAYAARDGQYRSLSTWNGRRPRPGRPLVGSLELPLAVGTVGGATRVHPTARAALQIMGVTTARDLAEIIVSVGLAQNLAAIRALATEGIQQGHMALHARQVAIAAGRGRRRGGSRRRGHGDRAADSCRSGAASCWPRCGGLRRRMLDKRHRQELSQDIIEHDLRRDLYADPTASICGLHDGLRSDMPWMRTIEGRSSC